MRLSKTLKQYSLCALLVVLIHSCHSHEHHNHIDPVTAKYSQPDAAAASIDAREQSSDTPNVPKTDLDQHRDDDTIDARLRAKHDLRKSIHEHTANDVDDRQESEEDYINRLNAPLENEYKTEHQFQYEPPPIADTANQTVTHNHSKENLQVPTPVQNETLSSPPPPPSQILTKQPEHAQVQPSSTQPTPLPPVVEIIPPIQTPEKQFIGKTLAEEVIPVLQASFNDQQPSRDTVQQNLVKEDILLIHKETLVTTQSHPRDPIPVRTEPSVEVRPSVSNPTISNPVLNNSSNDAQPLSPQRTTVDPLQQLNSVEPTIVTPATPVRVDPQQQTIDTVPKVKTPDVQEQQQQLPPAAQNDTTYHEKRPTVEVTAAPPTVVTTEQIKPVEVVTVEKKPLVEVTPPPPTLATPERIKPVEAVNVEKKLEDDSVASQRMPTSTQTPPRVLREGTSRIQQKAQAQVRHRHDRVKQESVKPVVEKSIPNPEPVNIEVVPTSTATPIVEIPSITTQAPEPREDSIQPPVLEQEKVDETPSLIPEPTTEPVDDVDLPRLVHVHDASALLQEQLQQEEERREALRDEIEQNTTSSSFLAHESTSHLPRILENDDKLSTIETLTTTVVAPVDHPTPVNESNTNPFQTESKDGESNNVNLSKTNTIVSNAVVNISDKASPTNLRQVCWSLPKTLDPSLGLVENQMFRFVNLIPEFLQTVFFSRLDNPEIVMNTLWFGSICLLCFFFSLLFLTLATKRLRQSKDEKAIRARCQQLQQYNNQIELERATFERQNQKLSDEIDELKNLAVRDTDEDLFESKEICQRLQAELKVARTERDVLHQDIDQKQLLIQRHDFEMQKQIETVAYLNNEILQQKQELEKERATISRLQSNDLSLERLENLQQTIHDLKSELTQLKQNKYAQVDQLQEFQERANQLDVENSQLTNKMKQLKELLEQRDETIARIRDKVNNDDDDSETDLGQLLSAVPDTTTEESQELLSTIDNDVEKAKQHMRQLHTDLDEKSRRIKELDSLLNQEKDRCREMETKLKVVLELRERDAHLHIRQLGQTDAELRKARTDTERVRILQQQLELKQQQLDDVQKVLSSEQTKFSEECSKLQHETHEKWMEVKRLTRELDTARKECEGLRRQITKYANNERSSQEKTMLKPVPHHHLNNTGRMSSDPETNGSSPPPPLSYQQGDNFRPIDRERNDSGAASPQEMFRARPPLPFGLPRPPFFPPHFLSGPPPNPFMMGPRFPMPMAGSHGMLSPIAHLMTNGSAGGSDANSFENVDSTNITPNSTSYDVQTNGSAASPRDDDEQPTATTKTKKPKKSLKKKTKTPTTATGASVTKEDV